MRNTSHLTQRANATLIAWHNERDVAAWRDADGAECLTINGKVINLSPFHHSPTQQVINICHQDRLNARRYEQRLLAL